MHINFSDFDAVMVCNGHYSVPKVPEVKNLDLFPGLQMHSHEYRSPGVFKGLRVVVLGAAASGTDIRYKERVLAGRTPSQA